MTLGEMQAVIGFGLDLSGYTTNKTSLAAVVANGRSAEAFLLGDSPFSRRRATDLRVRDVAREEARCLEQCLSIGPVAVDIPIDLQNLLSPHRAEEIWELTRRPIDRVLNAMAPLADRIGSPVARFSAIMREGGFGSRLGKDLFETYPSENLRRLGLSGRRSANGGEKRMSRRAARDNFCHDLALEISQDDDDDLDAIVCALAAIAHEDNLVAASEFNLDRGEPPRGFRILKRNPFDDIVLRKRDFSTWLTEQASASPV